MKDLAQETVGPLPAKDIFYSPIIKYLIKIIFDIGILFKDFLSCPVSD